MLEILVTLPLIALVVYGIIKGWYTQAVLIVAGFALLIAGWLLGNSPILPEAAAGGVKPTAFWFFFSISTLVLSNYSNSYCVFFQE